MAELVTVEIDGVPVACERGRPLLSGILSAGLPIATACGGQGICHLCRVQIAAGEDHLPLANAIERRALGNVLVAQGMRLSCQIVVERELRLTIPRRPSKAERRATRLRERAKK